MPRQHWGRDPRPCLADGRHGRRRAHRHLPTLQHNGTLGLIAYRATGTGYPAAFATGNMGQGSGALAWLAGDMDGDGLTDSFHTRISNSTIDVNVYISSGTGYSYDYTYSLCCFSNLSTHGFLVGSFDGGPRESLLHLFPFSGV